MEWLAAMKESINFIENHLLEDFSAVDVADHVNISPFYFQKGFAMITGTPVMTYVRNRRLFLAGLAVIADKEKVIDLAYTYGYETPESFTKAFTRFHGVSPAQLVKQPDLIQIFQPFTISITVTGGKSMDFSIEKKESFSVIGMGREFDSETSYGAIPKFWDEFMAKDSERICKALNGKCNVGMYGICFDGAVHGSKFHYLIAGDYKDGIPVPDGCEVRTIKALTWAKFRCVGPMPEALQSVNTKIWKEWLPGNGKYTLDEEITIEMYSMGDPCSSDYYSEIWIPVKEI